MPCPQALDTAAVELANCLQGPRASWLDLAWATAKVAVQRARQAASREGVPSRHQQVVNKVRARKDLNSGE